MSDAGAEFIKDLKEGHPFFPKPIFDVDVASFCRDGSGNNPKFPFKVFQSPVDLIGVKIKETLDFAKAHSPCLSERKEDP